MKIYRIAQNSHSSGDEEYLAAIESGDTTAAQSVVMAAAHRNGYTFEGWHNSHSAGIKEFLPFAADVNGGQRTPEEAKSLLDKYRSRQTQLLPIGYMDFRSGTFFATDSSSYKGYGPNQYHVFIKAENPLTKSGREQNLLIKNRPLDALFLDMDEDGKVEEIAIFDPTQIKSADLVTRDDAGNIIPLSQRFDSSKSDMRY